MQGSLRPLADGFCSSCFSERCDSVQGSPRPLADGFCSSCFSERCGSVQGSSRPLADVLYHLANCSTIWMWLILARGASGSGF